MRRRFTSLELAAMNHDRASPQVFLPVDAQLLILEQSNATGTSGSMEDWVVTLYLQGAAGDIASQRAHRARLVLPWRAAPEKVRQGL